MRLIDGDELMESLKAWKDEAQNLMFASAIIAHVNAMPTIEPEDRCGECDAWNQYKNYSRRSQWIPCGERLPKENGQYLITEKGFFGDYLYVSIANYGVPCMPMNKGKGRGWFITDSEGDYYCDMNHVIAWMPLTEPYKEGREE